MKLVKLDAIDSTNEFLKALSIRKEVENFTVVSAENQTHGKGQMGSVWSTETGKNLIMSVLVKDCVVDISQLFQLNIVVALAVVEAVQDLEIPNLSIKWPNDIMSDTKKIGGILIENTIKSDGTIQSIVGVGLNVNQTHFENLPKASSLALLCNAFFDKELLLVSIVQNLESKAKYLNTNAFEFKKSYEKWLFKKGTPMPFENKNGRRFMGIIQGTSSTGKLEILLEDDTISIFDIKEVQMLY